MKQFSRESDVIALSMILRPRATAAFKKILVRLRPHGGAVARDLRRAFFQPRRQFGFILAVRLIGFGKGADRQVVWSKRPKVPIFVALSIPDHARTPDPLAQHLSLVIGGCGFVTHAGDHRNLVSVEHY